MGVRPTLSSGVCPTLSCGVCPTLSSVESDKRKAVEINGDGNQWRWRSIEMEIDGDGNQWRTLENKGSGQWMSNPTRAVLGQVWANPLGQAWANPHRARYGQALTGPGMGKPPHWARYGQTPWARYRQTPSQGQVWANPMGQVWANPLTEASRSAMLGLIVWVPSTPRVHLGATSPLRAWPASRTPC